MFASLAVCGGGKKAPVPDASLPSGTGGGELADAGERGTGGSVGVGGALASGGASASGGVGLVGGAGSGGAAGTGGAPRGGGSTGAGGAVATGGRTGRGGVTGGGGVLVTGGTVGVGGSTTGGVLGTGGLSGTGGLASGGATGAGGSTSSVAWPAKFVGNIDARNKIPSDFVNYWDQFTPETAGKWASVQGTTSSAFRWDTLDTMVKYCQDHGIVFKEQSFIWGASQPSWFASLDTTTGPAAVKNWMKSFCDRYPDTRVIDVVNEPPPHTLPSYANAIGGGTSTTWDWIANAFKWAREACPHAVLLMNDYNNIESATDVQNTIDIVTAIKRLGAPIDAIGCEAHDPKKYSASTLKENIDRIVAATGLPVYISQYDIDVRDDEEQRRLYEDHITMFWQHPDVKGITLWGYISGATWVTYSGIMSSDGTMRPAMSWLMGFLGR